MRGYPGSRGTGGKLGINPNKPPADQTTFETTEPLRDETLPEDGLRLTALPLVQEDELVLPKLTTRPVLDVNELKGNLNPYDPLPNLEVPIKEGRLKTSKFLVTEVNDSKNICLRTVDYSSGLLTLEKEMSDWYNSHSVIGAGNLRMMDIVHHGYYAAEIVMPHEGRFCWARVSVIEHIPVNSAPRPIKVAALDYGFESEVLPHKLALLRKCFREQIPRLGLKAELKKKSSKYTDEEFDDLLRKHLVKKTVEMYDGQFGEDGMFTKVSGILFFPDSGETVQNYLEKL